MTRTKKKEDCRSEGDEWDGMENRIINFVCLCDWMEKLLPGGVTEKSINCIDKNLVLPSLRRSVEVDFLRMSQSLDSLTTEQKVSLRPFQFKSDYVEISDFPNSLEIENDISRLCFAGWFGVK